MWAFPDLAGVDLRTAEKGEKIGTFRSHRNVFKVDIRMGLRSLAASSIVNYTWAGFAALFRKGSDAFAATFDFFANDSHWIGIL